MRTVQIMKLDEFTRYTNIDYMDVCDTVEYCFSFGDADDTLVSPGRLCAALAIDVPAALPTSVLISLGS